MTRKAGKTPRKPVKTPAKAKALKMAIMDSEITFKTPKQKAKNTNNSNATRTPKSKPPKTPGWNSPKEDMFIMSPSPAVTKSKRAGVTKAKDKVFSPRRTRRMSIAVKPKSPPTSSRSAVYKKPGRQSVYHKKAKNLLEDGSDIESPSPVPEKKPTSKAPKKSHSSPVLKTAQTKIPRKTAASKSAENVVSPTEKKSGKLTGSAVVSKSRARSSSKKVVLKKVFTPKTPSTPEEESKKTFTKPRKDTPARKPGKLKAKTPAKTPVQTSKRRKEKSSPDVFMTPQAEMPRKRKSPVESVISKKRSKSDLESDTPAPLSPELQGVTPTPAKKYSVIPHFKLEDLNSPTPNKESPGKQNNISPVNTPDKASLLSKCLIM